MHAVAAPLHPGKPRLVVAVVAVLAATPSNLLPPGPAREVEHSEAGVLRGARCVAVLDAAAMACWAMLHWPWLAGKVADLRAGARLMQPAGTLASKVWARCSACAPSVLPPPRLVSMLMGPNELPLELQPPKSAPKLWLPGQPSLSVSNSCDHRRVHFDEDSECLEHGLPQVALAALQVELESWEVPLVPQLAVPKLMAVAQLEEPSRSPR